MFLANATSLRSHLNSAYWVIFHAYLSSADFFSKYFFFKNTFRNTIPVSYSLNPDQGGHFVGPDLGPNYLQRLSADDTSRQRVNCLSAVYTTVILLSHLLMYFGSLYCKQLGPKSNCSQGTRLISIPYVCYYGKSSLECILFYYIPDVISRHFWDKKYWQGKG